MKSLFRMMTAVAAASVGLAVFAADAVFTALPMCGKVNGVAQIRTPGSEQWEVVSENKYYPLGSSYRTVGADSSLEVYFGEKSFVVASGDTVFNVEKRDIGEATRSLSLQAGTIDLNLPRNLPEGLFTLTARGFTVKNPAGESRFVCRRTGDGDMTVARCVTGTMSLSGMHFNIPAMRAADELKIRTSHDLLYTGLNCTSGDFPIILEQGMVAELKNVDTGEVGSVAKTLEWKMSPNCAVRIHRSVPSVGERMSVAVMTFDAAGELSNFRTFSEGRREVNSGELVVKQTNSKEADLDKKAAEVTEAAADVEEGAVGDEAEKKSDDDSKEASDGDSETEE